MNARFHVIIRDPYAFGAIALCFLLWLVPSCASTGLGRVGTSFSDSLEPLLAGSLANSVIEQMPMVEDEDAVGYLQELTDKLAAHSGRSDLAYRAFIVDSDDVNAFTVGGGYVFVHKGLLARSRSESELAGVVAHEIGHNVGRHLSKTLVARFGVAVVVALAQGENPSQAREIAAALLGVGGSLYALKLSRSNEAEADSLGVDEMVKSGIDPAGLPGFFGVLRDLFGDRGGIEQYFSEHPPLADRINSTERIISKYPATARTGLAKDSPRFQQIRKRMVWLTRYAGVDTFVVDPGGKKTFELNVDVKRADSLSVRIDVQTRGGTGNDIKLVLADSIGAERLKRNENPGDHAFVKTISRETLALPIKNNTRYYLVFDNSISTISKKTVIASLALRYKAI